MADPVKDDDVTEPNMTLAQTAFRYSSAPTPELEAELRTTIEAASMAPYYEYAVAKFGWTLDEALLAKMKAKNDKDVAAARAKHDDAVKNHGDMEILDALFEIAKLYARIGAKELALEAYDVIRDRPKISTGKRIDALMAKIRISLFFLDTAAAKLQLTEAKKLAADGGDWDRNNRLAVYESIFMIINRDVKDAAKLLLGGVATFTCTELCTYPEFVFYAVITNLLALDRPALKQKVIDGPDVLQVIKQIPNLSELVTSLYNCEYAEFFKAILALNENFLKDRYFAPHARFLVRELRVLVYTQFLDAYKSVTLEAMAELFGVSVAFLDRELAHFISCGRLNAKIDKVGNMVETNRPDFKSAHYQMIIKQGDLLLNRIQKLARCVAI